MTLTLAQGAFISSLLFLCFIVGSAFELLRRVSLFSLLLPLLIVHHSFGVYYAPALVHDYHGVEFSENAELTLYLALSSSNVLLGTGAWLGRVMMPNSIGRSENWIVRPAVGVALASLSIIVLVHDIVGRISAGFLDLLSSTAWTSDDYTLIRSYSEEMLFSGGLAFMNFSIAPFMLIYSLRMRRLGAWRIVFLLILMLVAASAILSAHKSAIFGLLAALLLGRIYDIQFSPKHAIGFMGVCILAIFAVAPLLYLVQYPQYSMLDGIEATAFRLFLEPNRALYLYFGIFPEVEAFRYMSGTKLGAVLYGLQGIPTHTLVPEMFGVFGSTWNVLFAGDAWADFGWWGVTVGSLTVGVYLGALDTWLRTRVGSHEICALGGVLSLAAMRLAYAPASSVLIGFGLLSSVILFRLAFRCSR